MNSSLLWLKKLREEQMNAFIAQGLPTRKLEDWHYTDISSIKNHSLKSIEAADVYSNKERLEEIVANACLSTESHLLVFVDGYFNASLSKIHALPDGVILSNVGCLLKTHPNLIEPYLVRFSEVSIQNPFICLNTAMMQDGLFLSVPEHVQMKQPVHVLCLTNAESEHHNAVHLRHIIVGSDNSSVNVFENYRDILNTSGREKFHFNTMVTQIYAGKNTVMNHYKLQSGNSNTYYVDHTTVKQEQNSAMYLYNFPLGACLTRNNLEINLDASGARCQLNGLYILENQEHSDQHIVVNHRSPNASSEQLYRGIVGGNATAVFNGRVVVHSGAQKTDAKQSNKNILLSKSATVNTKPDFEIYANDVQCIHGATVGYFDESAFFYLRSRGLDKKAAMYLLMDAFVSIILKQITEPAIAEKMTTAIKEKMSKINHA